MESLNRKLEFLANKGRGRNKVDLFQYNYNIRISKSRKLGLDDKTLLKGMVDDTRNYLLQTNRKLLDASFMNAEKRELLRNEIESFLLKISSLQFPGLTPQELVNEILHEITGFGIIQPLIDEEDITSIFINGAQQQIRYKKNGKEKIFSRRYENEEEILELSYKIANTCGVPLNTSKPFASCTFDYLRIHIELAVTAGQGTTISIRKHVPYLRASEENMLIRKTVTKDMLNLIQAAVLSQLNILIVGLTGVGKTEFIRYMAGHIPDDERTKVFEDNRELLLDQLYPEKHFISSQCRLTGNKETTIDFDEHLRESLRQEILRMIVGESRGKEADQMMKFFRTGHTGFTSIHAPTSKDSVERLVEMLQEAGHRGNDSALYRRIGTTFDLIINIKVYKNGYRVIKEITEVEGFKNNEVKLNPLYNFRVKSHKKDDKGTLINVDGEFQQVGHISSELHEKFFDNLIDEELYTNLLDKDEVLYA